MTSLQQVLDLGYEVKLPVFEGPLDLLLYLVEKNELNTKDISIAAITDQYLEHLAALTKTDLGEAGEFLVMASRLMRLKARELLPADDKDPLEEMEYLLDRQALIAQMLEYRKFKEAARSLRDIEARNFGAFPRGRVEKPSASALAALENTATLPGLAPAEAVTELWDEEGESEAGIYDLLAAFKSVLAIKPRIPVHEVEIDEVTIEDRMQHVETELIEVGRILFEDLFGNDPRVMAKVVTFMALLELCKLDRIVVRQNRAFGTIWVYRKDALKAKAGDDRSEAVAQELAAPEPEPDETVLDVKPGLVTWVQEQILQRKSRSALDQVLLDLERELREEELGGEAAPAPEGLAGLESLAAAMEPGAAEVDEVGPDAVPEPEAEDDR
jgi:chromatin segregation and condensation protein Rec8/ScpA/Scc1 (kleisin family)